jgi:hypothetical protein
MKIKNIFVLLVVATSLNSNASILGSLSKLGDKLTSKQTKRISATRAISQYTRGRVDDNPLKKLVVMANDGEVRDAEALKSIGDKLIESDFRNMDVVESLDDYFPNRSPSQANYVHKKILSAIQLHVHNHLILKKMSPKQRAPHIQYHKDNVTTLAIQIPLKMSYMRGPGRDVDDLRDHMKALRQVHFDLINL